MTFVIILLILGGLALIFSGVENQSLVDYLKTWIGGKSATAK